jgi:transmembrane sensor
MNGYLLSYTMKRNHIEDEQQAKYKLHYFRKENVPVLSDAELQAESDLIYTSLMKDQSARKVKLWYPAAAAAAVAMIVAGAYLFNNQQSAPADAPQQAKMATKKVTDFAPGKTSATLTLANGEKIDLSRAANGKIAEQNGMSISKTADGRLIYAFTTEKQPANDISTRSTVFNTLSTVKGQQYQVILPDGSKVWLNAASSITYPANFAQLKDRKVKLSGEAYFEVAKDKNHPFIVKTDQQQVEVLGTHFNVNSYGDEKATKTTLLEGSVKVSNDLGQKVLLPGQQSELVKNRLRVSRADVNKTVAWKNGDFVFNDEELGSILRQLERWYNVKIDDNGKHPNLHLTGTISRSKNLLAVLQALEMTGGVKFKIEGNTVAVE